MVLLLLVIVAITEEGEFGEGDVRVDEGNVLEEV